MPIAPDAIEALLRLGVAGLAILGLFAFYRGDLRSGRLVDSEIKRLIEERDVWMQRALASDQRVDRLADAVETALSIKVPD